MSGAASEPGLIHYFAEEYINAIGVCCLCLLSSSHEYEAVESH